MRVSIGLPTDRVDAPGEFLTAEAVAELAVRVEICGLHGVYVTDHPAPDVRWLERGGHHALEPTVVLGLAGAATHGLILHTNVYVLPYRNPWLAAKALATVDVLCGGRLVVGVAAGYLLGEFEALDAPFEDRGRVLDERIEGLIAAWSGEPVRVGDAEVRALPTPAARPHPPLWAGGNSLAAIRRAATTCQGWSPLPTPAGMARAVRTRPIESIEDLAEGITELHRRAAEAGRDTMPDVCFVPFSLAGFLAAPDDPSTLRALVDEVHRLEDIGVTWVALQAPGRTRTEVVGRIEALAAVLADR